MIMASIKLKERMFNITKAKNVYRQTRSLIASTAPFSGTQDTNWLWYKTALFAGLHWKMTKSQHTVKTFTSLRSVSCHTAVAYLRATTFNRQWQASRLRGVLAHNGQCWMLSAVIRFSISVLGGGDLLPRVVWMPKKKHTVNCQEQWRNR